MKHLMSGNEATARGVYEAGIKVCSAYPGTPSTEILENMPQYGKDVYCEWAPNEKVAAEVAYGAAVAGSRAFCTMKMVGLNVAADPLFTAGGVPVFMRRERFRLIVQFQFLDCAFFRLFFGSFLQFPTTAVIINLLHCPLAETIAAGRKMRESRWRHGAISPVCDRNASHHQGVPRH